MVEQSLVKSSGKSLSGARFFKFALHVNPFEYLVRHGIRSQYCNETDYNAALIDACKEAEVEAIAVTDHYRIYPSARLLECARAAGIVAFPGFEAVTSEGVHLLCIFDPSMQLNGIDRIIGECGVRQDNEISPTGDYDVVNFLGKCQSWNAVCIAAHVTLDGGLLTTLKGQPRIRAWTSPNLLACSLNGPIEGAPDSLRPILQNKNAEHRRDREIAIINANDVGDPRFVENAFASTLLKMSRVSIEGVRQAFLDPNSRVRLNSDPDLEGHAELVELAWEGGFLDRASIRFNPNLNVLVGGRGAGKSTVIESIRYVLDLDPIGEEARESHVGLVRQVLKGGTKVSLCVRSHIPAERTYQIERTVPNPPIVKDEGGQILTLLPRDVFPRVEVFGQHEISELARSPEKLTSLLSRFKLGDETLERRKENLSRSLEKSRGELLDIRSELQETDERLMELPRLQETLSRFQEAGLEDRLREQSSLVREEGVLTAIYARHYVFQEHLESLRKDLPIDPAFLSARALEGLPGKEILSEANAVLERLSQDLHEVANLMEQALERAEMGIDGVRSRWNVRKQQVEEAFHKILRELNASSLDGEEFIRLRREVESLRPLLERRPLLEQLVEEHEQRRRLLLAEWEDTKAEEFRLFDRAARRVSRNLRGRVRVEVTSAGDREPLLNFLRKEVGGRLSQAIDKIKSAPDVSLPEFVQCCRSGEAELYERFSIPMSQGARIVQASPETMMRIEELELPPKTSIQLNTASANEPPSWQAIQSLSSGQKATAVLLLLLLKSDAPLIIDQPEDDLDNRFITEGIVPKIREEKRRRQFVFSTHNANIPVLGDAELIIGLTPKGEAEQGRATILAQHTGSLDEKPVRELVEEILEGGKQAFETRRLKYGF